MKTLNEDYIYQHALVTNESISDIFKNFWNWLIGNNKTDKDLMASSDNFDEVKLKDIIRTSSFNVYYEPINNIEIVKRIIKENTNEEDNICYFDMTKNIIQEHKIDKDNTDYNWYSIILDAKKHNLKSVVGIISYFTEDNNNHNAASLVSIDIHKLYKNKVTTSNIENCLNKILTKKDVLKKEIVLKKRLNIYDNDGEVNESDIRYKETNKYIKNIKKYGTLFDVKTDKEIETLVYRY